MLLMNLALTFLSPAKIKKNIKKIAGAHALPGHLPLEAPASLSTINILIPFCPKSIKTAFHKHSMGYVRHMPHISLKPACRGVAASKAGS